MTYHIAVVGGASADEEALRQATRVGAAIARAGQVLICGGLGGTMEAASRGAWEEGGLTVGILPGSSRADANPYIRVAIATGLGHFRNFLVVQSADAVIAMPGRSGTLSEVAMAVTLAKPVVSLGGFQLEGVTEAQAPDEAVQLTLRLLD